MRRQRQPLVINNGAGTGTTSTGVDLGNEKIAGVMTYTGFTTADISFQTIQSGQDENDSAAVWVDILTEAGAALKITGAVANRYYALPDQFRELPSILRVKTSAGQADDTEVVLFVTNLFS